jgi:hypothetical protein
LVLFWKFDLTFPASLLPSEGILSIITLLIQSIPTFSTESERKPECVPMQVPLANTAINVPETVETAPLPMMQPVQQSVPQSLALGIDGGKSFADTLKAAAQLELKSPGLLAKLARQNSTASSFLVSSVLSL